MALPSVVLTGTASKFESKVGEINKMISSILKESWLWVNVVKHIANYLGVEVN